MPALRVAPVGTPAILIASVSDPSVSVSAAAMWLPSAIAVSSLPAAAVTVSVGVEADVSAGAGASIVTFSVLAVVAVVPLSSVETALTVSAIGVVEFAGGVIVRLASWAGVTVQMPPLLVPALSVAPVGTPVILIASVSDPSVSVSAAVRWLPSAIAVFFGPWVSDTVRVGASATPVTLSARVADLLAVAPPLDSVEVAVTVRLIGASELFGGVIVSPASWAVVSVQMPPPLFVPA